LEGDGKIRKTIFFGFYHGFVVCISNCRFEVEVVIGTVFKNLSPGPSPKERGDVSGGKISNNLQFDIHTGCVI